ncbi:MAG TPA: tetratricopeptide repeat protein, partial [Terriglobales bacterium]|nr:tetratricopeptide repeat protein [Terriglobales bacterium]
MPQRKLLVLSVVIVTAFLFAIEQNSPPADKTADAARVNNIGAGYMNQQLFEKALKNFEDAARLDPNLQVARVNQGIALLNLGRIEAARSTLEEVVKRDPNDAHAWDNLGLLYKNSGDADGAITAFHRALDVGGDDADTWYFLGSVFSQAKQYDRAINAFNRALKLNSFHASAEFGLSRDYQQSGDLTRAREHLTRFQYITQNKLGSPISLAYGEQGKYSLAEESLAAQAKVPPQIAVKFVDVTK